MEYYLYGSRLDGDGVIRDIDHELMESGVYYLEVVTDSEAS